MRGFHIHLITTGGLSLLFYLGLLNLSKEFNWGEGYPRRPIPEYLLLYFSLFVIYALAVWRTLRSRTDARAVWWIFGLGLGFRLILMPANQIQEDDIYRYLWDGKVFAHGVNPYRYAPDEVTEFKRFMIQEPSRFAHTYDGASVRELETLAQLKWENERALTFMERINHPHLPTIYPPLAQYVFRLVAGLAPDSILAMRLAFLGFDLMTFFFLTALLKALGKPPAWSLIYFWSPLIVKETFNSTHLDIIGIAFLTGSLYFLVRARFWSAHLFLALSVLGKLYPAILFPFFLREQIRRAEPAVQKPALGGSVGIFLGVVGLFYLPFLDIGTKAFAGLKSFSVYWQSNDSIFALLVWFFRDLVGITPAGEVGFSYDLPSLLAKITVLIVLAAVWLKLLAGPRSGPPYQSGPPEQNRKAVLPALRHLFIVLGLVFLLSPVQNPWYLCWMVPLLCVFPMRSWILLTGLAGLYYLDFYLSYQNLTQYSGWIPWVEYLPFYLVLLWEVRRRKKSAPVQE